MILRGLVKFVNIELKPKIIDSENELLKNFDLSDDNINKNVYDSVQTELKVLAMGESFGKIYLKVEGTKINTAIALEETHLACLKLDLYDKFYCNN